MQRLTWTGIAMHAGYLPGYPASAGCVRLPVDFAEKLYSVTGIGTTVIIADNKSAPSQTLRPGLLFSGKTGTVPPGGFVWRPETAPKGPISIIVSAPDGKAYIYRNGVEIGRAPVVGLEATRLSGTHVYSALATTDASGRRDWITTARVGRKPPNLKDLVNRISIDSSFLRDVPALTHQERRWSLPTRRSAAKLIAVPDLIFSQRAPRKANAFGSPASIFA